ncbi:FHA domain-containing protein [Alienimonas sp. DA493]|uniref:FHA domain-containing protein n=1 Tax=Alienimonas sp. DA493 TaxID=3373605 RepID=UPI00375520A6
MLSAQLVVRGGKHEGKRIVLNRGRFLIGREQDCNLRPSSDLVSRHHCVFHMDDYTVRLRDLGSTNGTLVNGERLSGERTLAAGDRVTVGKLTFEVDLKEVADEQEAAEVVPSEEMSLPADGADTSYELPVNPAGEGGPGQGGGPIPGPNPNDTAMIPTQQGYPPPGYGYPPQYPPPGYNPYAQPGYPPQYPGYPPQYGQYPPQGGPPQGATPPPESPDGSKVSAPPVKLPPPPKRD